MSQTTDQTRIPQPESAPVIVWEQQANRPQEQEGNVISIDAYRRGSSSEATVTTRTLASESPVRLVIVSSGFGQKPAHNTVRNAAA
ncbi:hypothetical protein [Paenibacillus aestuarii]|uniref:Uncharacterized protein n=1 Tax=Paenibacillus aestuarii TaxID=516965 RepID=A0ABW0K0R4_9BACL|nr:hypothetical protein [Paenibacillus aestuarii]